MSRPVSLPKALKPYAHTVTGKRVFGKARFVNGAWTSAHNGVDFATPTGLPLESGIRGTVSLVGGSLTHQWGYYIHIICDCPLKHVQEFHVCKSRPDFEIGDEVEIGQIVAHTGSSGSFNKVRYAPHHHHGTSEGGVYYNPLTIGWPEGAFDSHQPLDNEEDDMTPDQARQLKETHEMTAAIRAEVAAIHDAVFFDTPTSKGTPGGVLVTLKVLGDRLQAVYDALFFDTKTSKGTPGGVLVSLKAALDKLDDLKKK